ncbi:MAG: D-lyxose/D-mannose family sugar isomerase [Clostridia bacterium]|nr:D-lyxose/D-mannose family sugar isomerase [Clostridia bacterium]
MKRSEYKNMQRAALSYYQKAGIVLTDDEKTRIEVADFGLNTVAQVGLEILTYINTERVCAKEMVLLPHQACPEHRHVFTDGQPGKEETFRCRWGKVYLYTDTNKGAARERIAAPIPPTTVTVFDEHVLMPGDQYTIYPETLHWFSAGEEGAVISEFSTHSTDETDEFTDTRIVRMPVVEED